MSNDENIFIINQKIDYWLDSAMSNFEASKILLDNKKFLQALFYCNLTIEKAIKAYYWKLIKEEPPFTHNLIILFSKTDLFQIMSESHKETLTLLMPLNIKTRYPDEEKELLKVYSLKKCNEIYNSTKDLFQWIIQLLKK